LKPATLNNFDFSRYSGVPCFLDGAPGWKCGSCDREMLFGPVIDAALLLMAMAMVEVPHRLAPEMAKYLRRSMQITQQELAGRMGVVRETVAHWESGLKEISPQHDLILRVLMINHARGSESLPTKIAIEIANDAIATLSAGQSDPAPRNAPDFRVTEAGFKKLPATLNKPPRSSAASASSAVVADGSRSRLGPLARARGAT
jgi:DNA-binding transcriptional regulator YiaG